MIPTKESLQPGSVIRMTSSTGQSEKFSDCTVINIIGGEVFLVRPYASYNEETQTYDLGAEKFTAPISRLLQTEYWEWVSR